MNPPGSSPESIPFFQRLLDRPFVMLAAGLAVMLAFYTLWGLAEILNLPQAGLP